VIKVETTSTCRAGATRSQRLVAGDGQVDHGHQGPAGAAVSVAGAASVIAIGSPADP
jgi:hypothetical protein